MTDFFQQQEAARGRTRLLMVLFAGAVLVVIALIYLLHGVITFYGSDVWNPSLLVSASIACGIIGTGSGIKMMQLSSGGSAVARDLGGRVVDAGTIDTDERRLLNVVEEMSIASGVPVPQVWVMDEEDGINAFAAGHSPSDAVIGVTRGCMRALTRDELQGVIAHEFSHILNGDMKLNLRLIGVVHGILAVAIIGRGIFRVAANMSGGKNSPQVPMFALGGALFVIGYAGVILGRIIKSAVSRQREYLADASAVQFTRNPQGIGRALMKIGGYTCGSRLRTANAEEASHMMFGNVFSRAASLFSTHPPLEDRIRAILPDWDGKYTPIEMAEISAAPHRTKTPKLATPPWAGVAMHAASPQEIVARVGMLSPADMENAARLRDSIPEELIQLLRDPGGAQAAVFGLLLSDETSAEAAMLGGLVDAQTLQTAKSVAATAQAWHSTRSIALIDLAIPSLRRLTLEEYRRFAAILDQLMHCDQQIDLFEFMVQRMVQRHLDRWFRKAAPPPVRYRAMPQLQAELETVLTAISGVGKRTPGEAAAAVQAGQRLLAEHGVSIILQARPTGLDEVGTALEQFDAATPLLKKQLLMACVAVANEDGYLADEEAELLRAVADTIGCPLPPLAVGDR